MKMFVKIVGAVMFLGSLNVQAESRFLDREPLRQCGGEIELREAANGDLAIKIENINLGRCDSLVFRDKTSSRVIKGYDIQQETASFTLSKSMRSSLSDDCRVNFTISGSYRSESFDVVLSWCSQGSSNGGSSASGKSYQLSNKGNCKLLINGQYSNQNVDGAYCQGASSTSDIVSYELSNKGNCKLMINSQYSNQNVSDAFCR